MVTIYLWANPGQFITQAEELLIITLRQLVQPGPDQANEDLQSPFCLRAQPSILSSHQLFQKLPPTLFLSLRDGCQELLSAFGHATDLW